MLKEWTEKLEGMLSKATPGRWKTYSGGGFVSVGVNKTCEVLPKRTGSIMTEDCQAARDYELLCELKNAAPLFLSLLRQEQPFPKDNDSFQGPWEDLLELAREKFSWYEAFTTVCYEGSPKDQDLQIQVHMSHWNAHLEVTCKYGDFMGIPLRQEAPECREGCPCGGGPGGYAREYWEARKQ